MRNLANSLLKRTTTIARYISPNAWWAIPLSVLVVGLTARIVESRVDWLLSDNYRLMAGVEKPFQEFAKISVFGLPLELHYWLSYRVFGSSLSGYLVLPLTASLATLPVIYFGIKRQWGHTAWGVCFFTMAILAFNWYSLYLAQYAMFTYGNGLLVSTALFFLFLYLCSHRLTRKQWTWVAVLFIPAALFTNIYILVPVFMGAVSVFLVRLCHLHRRYRLNDLRLYLIEIWPLAIFPVMQFATLFFHPSGHFSALSYARSVANTDAFFFSSSQYPHSLWGAVQFVSNNTITMFSGLLNAPYTNYFGPRVWLLIVIATLVILVMLSIRMAQRKLEQGISFVVTFTVLTLLAMVAGGLLGLYPYGRERQADFLLLPLGLIFAFAASSVLTRIMASFRGMLTWKAVPVILALAILAAGTIRNVNQYRYNTDITDRNWAALHQIKNTNADLVLISGSGMFKIQAIYPDLYASGYDMGWGKTGVFRSFDDTVPHEVVEAIESPQGPRTVLVIWLSKARLDAYYPSWSTLLAAYFDYQGDITGPSIAAAHYTRKE